MEPIAIGGAGSNIAVGGWGGEQPDISPTLAEGGEPISIGGNLVEGVVVAEGELVHVAGEPTTIGNEGNFVYQVEAPAMFRGGDAPDSAEGEGEEPAPEEEEPAPEEEEE